MDIENSTTALARAVLRTARRGFFGVRNRMMGYEPVGGGTVPKSLQICTDDACRLCAAQGRRAQGLRIIYLLPTIDKPIGGNKVSYRHIETIAREGVACMAFHAEKPGTSYSWFTHNVHSLPLGHLDPRRDFLVFSEIWAAIAAKFCVPAGLRYAIFVQNGYLAHHTAGFAPEVAAQAYRHADLVLSISEDTTGIIELTWPFVPREKILRLTLSVPTLFAPGPKQRWITYMPRKLPDHAARMRRYLQSVLRDGWELRPIDQLDERGVAELLARSSIFLSFSELEGYGLPPVEAALAGNLVVGYTGQGGREYFARPLFREIPNGDFLQYVEAVKAAIREVEQGAAQTEEAREQRARLVQMHSAEREIHHLQAFIERVRAVMQSSTQPHPVEGAHPPDAIVQNDCVGRAHPSIR